MRSILFIVPTVLSLLSLSACGLLSGPEAPPPAGPDTPAAALRGELRELHRLREYRAGKNSFVLGLEQVSGIPRLLQPGERRTILDLEGQGSLRHIWETHGEEPDPMVYEFYVDGESSPSIRAGMEQLVAAAARAEQGLVAVAASTPPKGSNNFYLPVPFEKSLRIEALSEKEIGLVFLQLDYRLEDDSLEGLRLRQRGEGDALELYYEGQPPLPEDGAAPTRLERRRIAGEGEARFSGPGIVRRLGVSAQRPGARLKIRFDGAKGDAVDADLADFFGPFRGVAFNNNQCYLPMPFARTMVLSIEGVSPNEEFTIEAEIEPVQRFEPDWAYLHARSVATDETLGYRPMPLLYTTGRGHWVGLHLYDSDHDHGGGDFAVIDGRTERPAFLHGINGEDYFSFAFFGRGENFPYSEAFDNSTGRTRLHLENPYPFRESISIGWGSLRGLAPRAVNFWYQEQADDLSLDAAEARGLEWEVFGQLPYPTLEDGLTPDLSDPDAFFAPLPEPEALDAGREVKIRHHFFGVHEGVFAGWREQRAVDSFLDLMYVYRHVLDIGGHSHMGYCPRLMMARTCLDSPRAQRLTLQLSYDDPIEVELNGVRLHRDLTPREGFTTVALPADFRAGENRLLLRLADTPGNNTAWAGVNLRVLDAAGRDVGLEMQR